MEYIKLCEVISSAKTERCGASDYPVLSITKSDGVVLQSDKFKKRIASTDTEQYKLVKRGQLVQGIHIDEANFGIQSIVDIGIVSPAYKIWNVDFQKIVPKYLETVLRSPRSVRYYSSKFNGSVKRRERITDSDFLAMEIPFPSKEQQQYAVDVLEKACSMTTLYQQQLQKLDELVKARFVEMFGDPEINSFDWPVCTLKELVSIEPQNGLYKPQSAYVQDGSGFPIVRIDAFYDGRITNFSALKRLECSESEVQRYLLQENDIVINRVNSIEYLGKCAHIKGLLEETVFESNMMRLHLDDTVMNAVFATKLLCSQYIYKQIMVRAKKAVNQASINQQDVLSFRMFVPPLELQEQFAAFVEQADKSKVAVQKALDETQLLFDSLMQTFFDK